MSASILIVDDEEFNREVLERKLKKHGFTTYSASNAKEGLMLLKKHTPDLMLLDLMMPEINGFQMMNALKKLPLEKPLKIIVLSAVQDKNLIQKSILAGAADYILKPFEDSDLIKRIKVALGLVSESESQAITTQTAEPPAAQSPAEPKSQAKTFIEELSEKLKNDDIQFTAFPKLGQEIIQRLQNENTPLEVVAGLLEKEPGMSAKILNAANSVQFAGAKACSHPKEAIVRIGVDRTLNYVLLVSTVTLFTSSNPMFERLLKEELKHTIITAIVARYVATISHCPNADQLFALAMFHDIGKVILLKILHDLSAHRPVEDEEVLNKILASLHTKFGASILKRWNFPAPFIQAALQHHEQPDRSAHTKNTTVIIISNLLSRIVEGDFARDMKRYESHPSLSMLGLKPQQLNELPGAVKKEMQALEAMLNS